MRYFLRLACHLRSWHYDIAGIIALSTAVNVFTAVASTKDLPLLLSLIVSMAWLALGIQSLWLGAQFRSREASEYRATDGEILAGELSKRLKERLEKNRPASVVVCGIAVSLLASIILTVMLLIITRWG